MPTIRTPAERAELDILEFQRLVADADVEFVGRDTEYVPDSPRLRADHPNAGD